MFNFFTPSLWGPCANFNLFTEYLKTDYGQMLPEEINQEISTYLFNNIILNETYDLTALKYYLRSVTIHKIMPEMHHLIYTRKLVIYQIVDFPFDHLIYLKSLNNLKVGRSVAIKNFHCKYLSQVTSLDISDVKTLTDVALKYLTHLRKLKINKTAGLKDNGIKNLTNLTKLSLGGNRCITDSIGSLTNLVFLSISDFSYIPPTVLQSLSKLTYLKWYSNNVESLESMTCLKSLQFLDSSFTPITNEIVSKLTNLTHLESCYEIISDEGIRHLTNLEELTLHSKLIGNMGIYRLTRLRELSLHAEWITGNGLWYLTDLVKLEVRSKLIRKTDLEHLKKLTSFYCPIKSLRQYIHDREYNERIARLVSLKRLPEEYLEQSTHKKMRYD